MFFAKSQWILASVRQGFQEEGNKLLLHCFKVFSLEKYKKP